MTQTLSTIIVLAIALLPGSAIAQSTTQANGTVQGVVIVFDNDGGPSVVPSVKVSLTGPANMEVQSDDAGIFAFDSVPQGDYRISAEAPGMTGTRRISVSPGTLSEVFIEVKLVALAESTTTVTVRADPANTKQPWGATRAGELASEARQLR
jgi:hypothetical protein